MKYLIVSLLSLIFITTAQAVRKQQANPINVAVMLTERTDSAAIARTLDYYGYVMEDMDGRLPSRPDDMEGRLPSRPDDMEGRLPSRPNMEYQLTTPNSKLTTYHHPNGSQITVDLSNPLPIVEVKSHVSPKDREAILQNLNFQKTANAYERRSVGLIVQATPAPRGALRLTTLPTKGTLYGGTASQPLMEGGHSDRRAVGAPVSAP